MGPHPPLLDDDIELAAGSNEATPLLSNNNNNHEHEPSLSSSSTLTTRRERLFEFLEARTPWGLMYEKFTAILILVNVVSFICGSLFVEQYNSAPWAQRKGGICGTTCDAVLFGNYKDNGLQVLQLGTTSLLEIGTVFVFSVDHLLRVWCADLENAKYKGVWGRIRYLPTFYSVVDLASTVPFYVDAFILRNQDIAASQFLRMFRLFRMMRVEGRYDTALTMFDDVLMEQHAILGTALFVGVTTWMTTSALYYLVERRNLDMIYCGAAPHCVDINVDTSLCTIDVWGFTNCTQAGCPSTSKFPEPCFNLFHSIPSAAYYSLLNLFGEFPLIDQHGVGGKIVGTLVAVLAAVVFALPAGIIGNGFEDLIARKRQQQQNQNEEEEASYADEGPMTVGFVSTTHTARGRIYNFLHAQTSLASNVFDQCINVLIVGTALSFMLDTLHGLSPTLHVTLDGFEFVAVVVFTVEYILRVYSCQQDPKYEEAGGRWKYMCTFYAVVDVLSVLPYWIHVGFTGTIVTSYSDSSSTTSATFVKCLRLLRLLRFEKYTHAFTAFDDVIRNNLDILAVTLYTALLLWVFFGAILYFSERDNYDPEMASNYNTVPNSMWVTLLNLTGESPLCQYSVVGKIVTGILGLFCLGVFGIPIGVLGAGFEEVIEEETEETPQEEEDEMEEIVELSDYNGMSPLLLRPSFEITCYKFVNGIGSQAATIFELSIYFLIFLTVAVGIWQTVDGQEDVLGWTEWFAVLVFTLEYTIRFIGAPADPYFGGSNNKTMARLRYIVSFYSIIDLLAIVPFYIAQAMPNSIVNQYDEYLRMLRLLRLVKLDKYIPSITLIDDVIRLKKNALAVACFAAGTLWILFSSLMYLTEKQDDYNGIDPVPLYGCAEDCTMMDRFQNFFDSMSYTSVHLTGDYPIITYTWPARFVNFFMVIAAVGVVSVPSGLVANGFTSICQSKAKKRRGEVVPAGGRAGDDWYEFRLAELQHEEPPPSHFGPKVDQWQVAVNVYLNGTVDENTGHTKWSKFGFATRVFIFAVIILNIIAVLLESVPRIDKFVGNQPGNFFDVFEKFSVAVFGMEYALRLFCARKNLEALYSPYVYATTFFGIVDLLSIAPWYIQEILIVTGTISPDDDSAKIFRMFRIFRMLQLEDFVTAFSKLDNVFRASKDVLKATGLMAIIVWVGCAALFYITEQDNPNWRSCDESIAPYSDNPDYPGCFDFSSTKECNEFYPGQCAQVAFTNMPNTLYYVAVFLGGEWGLIDFTWPGRFVCLFLCVAGIGLYSIPIGTLFDSFGAVLGMVEEEDEEEEEEGADEGEEK